VVGRSLPGLKVYTPSCFPSLSASQAGLKISNAVLGELARSLILSDTESDYNGNYKDTDGKRIVEKITTTWIQQFQEKTDL
jgi:hypothetical protein